MNEKRRRGGSGLGKKLLVWGGWGIVVALLGGNFVIALTNQKDDTPQGFVTIDMLQAAAFWVPIAACLVMSVLGLFWTGRAYAQTERNSLLWARYGYVFSLVGAVVLSMAVFDAETFSRPWLAALASLLFAGQTVFFAMLGLREYRRAETGEGSRHARPRRGRSGARDEPAAGAAADDPLADAPDASQ